MNQESIIKEFEKLKKIALVGASSKTDKWGYKIFKILQKNNFKVFPVHKSLKELEGYEVYSSVNDIEHNLDGAVFVVNPEIGINIADEIISKNIKYVWLQPGARSRELIEKLRDNNINVVHTECIYVHLSRGQTDV
jgi:predicted CoA-binding protein